MTKYLAVFVLLVPCLLYAGDLPDNAHPKAYGSGWDCNRGYYKAGEKCKKVIIPDNAGLNVYGNGWACNRGYYKSGEKCEKVIIPENAGLNVYGNGWTCNRGYYKAGEKCEKVIIPDNAGLNVYGNGWACNRGYYKSGEKCEKVIIPENAGLSVYGNGWTCNRGYKTVNNGCIPMTSVELERQSASEQAILKKIQERKLQGVRGDDCETEYRTNARVCVRITNADLDCSKSYSGNYYRDCDATIRYDVETDYSGGSYLDVEVECKVEIEYKGRQTYTTQSDWGRKDESYTLYAHGSESERMVFNFSFSSFAEVHRVKISSAKCEIESVDLR